MREQPVSKKSPKNVERREMVEKMRQDQARKERQRSLAILGVCVLIVLGLITAAVIPYLNDKREKDRLAKVNLDSIGASESAAGCDAVTTKSAEGSGQHKPTGVPLTYPDAPPAYGPHWANYLSGPEIRNFYTPQDRPEKERMVHALEHGHTIVWYDETVKAGTTAYTELEAIADKYPASAYYMTAPWTSADGGKFPEGKHIAMTHWTGPDNQQGAWQYCAKPSGEVIKAFTTKYPASSAPEPGAP